MKKEIETLQNAEYTLRNWTQANTDRMDHDAVLTMRLVCDMIRKARTDMKYRWE